MVDGNEHLPAFGDEQQRCALSEAEAAWQTDLAQYSTGLVEADENGFELKGGPAMAAPGAEAGGEPEPSN